MGEKEILRALSVGEDSDWEFKSARGGIPGSLWETYSGMCNTDGGTILLGITQHGDVFTVDGLDDPAKIRKAFWDTINNRGKVCANLLADEQVKVEEVAGKKVVVVHVPRASRRHRPVYVGQNPLEGTYRRNFEGDYKCRPDEVGRMLADQSEEALDSRIVEGFGTADLDPASVQQYRQRFSARSPGHPWLAEEESSFLEKLGAWRKDRLMPRRG